MMSIWYEQELIMFQSSDELLLFHFSGKQTAWNESECQKRAADSKTALDAESSWF